MKYWIWLAELRGISGRQKIALLHQFGEASLVYEQDDAGYAAAGMDAGAIKALSDKRLDHAERILDVCSRKDIQMLPYNDDRYPNRLRQIVQPPVLLYYKGKLLPFDDMPTVAAVGTRKASAYGYMQAKRLGYQMGKCGMTVVSGLARGIDTAAIEGALTADAPVAAVLGCGADVVYPKENRGLYADVQAHGCLLTEYPPGTPPEGRHFPIRNRILAGISLGVLVVEAGERSGALITARHALEQGRDVFAVPANLGVDGAKGSNRLLRDGAIYTESGWDVAREYWHLYPNTIRRPDAATMAEPVKMEPEQREKECVEPTQTDKKSIDKQKLKGYIDLHEIWQSLTDEERIVAKLLEAGPKQVDDLLDGAGISAAQVLATLTLLEVRGIVKRLPGRVFALAERVPE
jgi:DNA processing protein